MNRILIIAQDITELILKEEQIAREDTRWLFINTASHQLRTPLSNIENMMNLLKPYIKEQTETEYWNIANLCVKNLRHIVDDTIMFTQCSQNQIQMQICTVTINQIADDLERLFRFEAESKSIGFYIHYDNKIPQVLVDKDKLVHILFTLLSNAFKYTTCGKVSLDMGIIKSSSLLIEVSDTGVGINKEEQENLFSIFANINYLRKKNKTSTGLGLYIVKTLCTRMGGNIEYQTTIDSGTKFKVIIPITTYYDNSNVEGTDDIVLKQNIYSSTYFDKPGDLSKPRIMIVDDNLYNIYAIKSMLKKYRLDIYEAYNGYEAVKKYREVKCDIIIMDINMPVMNGLEASSVITKLSNEFGKTTTIYALSAQDEPLKADAYMSHGICKWLVKPISNAVIDELLSKAKII
jgi:nitrogen-specific signal transduction histidine kinase